MKRTILSKIALALGVVAAALAGLGQGQARANPSTFNVFTRCESNYIKVAGSHGMYESMVSGNPARVYFATYLMKYLPPNWVYTGRANTTWSRAAHDTERNVPYAVGPTEYLPSQRFAITEPGHYFVWVLFAYPNGNGGYSYVYKASQVCTIQGNVMSRPSGAKASKAKKVKAVKPAPARPSSPAAIR